MNTNTNIKFFLIFLFMAALTLAKAQNYTGISPLSMPYYASANFSASTTGTNYYSSDIIGRWVTDDGDEMMEISKNTNAGLDIDIYKLNTYDNKYEYQFTRYAPYVTTINSTYLFDWSTNSATTAIGPYVTCKYWFNGQNELYMGQIKQYVLSACGNGDGEYRSYLTNNMWNSSMFNTAQHFRRYGTSSQPSLSSSEVVGGLALLFLGACAVGSLLDGGSSSSSSYSSSSNSQSHYSFSSLGLDKDYNEVHDYNRTSEIKYDNDGNSK